MSKQRRTQRRKKAKSGAGIITIAVLLLCGLVSYKKMELNATVQKSAKRIEELEKEKQELVEEKDEISEYEAYVKTKKYVEEVAREKLGLVYEDEIIFDSDN
ncbi:septum formation initiator family protein [Anaeromicropila populeti]|uniref:Cell division protein FtsB n=1 Tax=Anaeromicropila populeti TaxID=37658 RepID=A0A1I6IY56_9FIRM|nr:septum formation initiator family protein [Anaeromicropila populeti]SFR71692.1 Cell division protein FtsB [Anaeromicropila populeti]